MFKDLAEKPQYEPTSEEITELLRKILKGEQKPLAERETDFLQDVYVQGYRLLREKLAKTGQLVKCLLNADREATIKFDPLNAAQQSPTIEERLTIIIERLEKEGVGNPIELLVKKVVRQRKHPNLTKETLETIERIKKISEEIVDKITEQLTEDKDRISKILEAFTYRFNKDIFEKAFNVGKRTRFPEEQITSVLGNSILAYVFDSNEEEYKKAETIEDPAVIAILEFRKQLYERLPEILGQPNQPPPTPPSPRL